MDSKTIRAIDTAGKTVWSMNFALDHKKMYLSDNIGDRFVATTDNDTSYTIIAGGKRIASSSGGLYLNQYSDTYIAAESTGYYALYNFKGKKLTKTYQNAFDEVGQNIYSRWINDKEYEYIRCDADGTNKVLFRVKPILNGGRPGLLATDGAGVYALPTDKHTITCFDRFGATLGTIKIEDTIDIYYRLSFENGCLRVVDSYPNGKTDAVNALYLPTGEQIS